MSSTKWNLKEQFIQKWQSGCHLFVPVLIESRYKCLSSQNIFGPSQEINFVAFSENNWSRWGLLFKHKNTAENEIKWLNPSLWKPRDPKLNFSKDFFPLFFIRFKTKAHLLQLLRRMLRCCTDSPYFLSALGWVDSDWNVIWGKLLL